MNTVGILVSLRVGLDNKSAHYILGCINNPKALLQLGLRVASDPLDCELSVNGP